MKKSLFSFFTILIMALVSVAVAQQIPMMMNYQGYITNNSSSVLINGDNYFKFAIVNTAGDTTVWSNDGTSSGGSEPTDSVTVAVTDGVYSVQLGDTSSTNMTSLPTTPFQTQNIHLRVWFSEDGVTFEQFTPDTQLVSSGFAHRAETVSSHGHSTLDAADGSPVGAVLVDDEGNVGIGTTSFPFNAQLEVTGSSGEPGIISFTSDTSVAVYGENTTNGAYGYFANQYTGVAGYGTLLGSGVYGEHQGTGNYGYLGNENYGVFGYSLNEYAGYFQGNAMVTGNLTVDTNLVVNGTILGEADPVFGASASSGITAGDITNWSTAFSWGNHSGIGYLTIEADPVFGASASSVITPGDITNWSTAFGWGDHAGNDTTDDSWTGTGDVFTTSGNVGIGTNSPAVQLDILGDFSVTPGNYLYTSQLSQSGILSPPCSCDTNIFISECGSSFFTNNDEGPICYDRHGSAMSRPYTRNSNPPPSLHVPTSGNVGIGMSSPTTQLDVLGKFKVTPGQYHYGRGTSVSGQQSPRCACDTVVGSFADPGIDCSTTFYTNNDEGATCYDWYYNFFPTSEYRSYPFMQDSITPPGIFVNSSGNVGIGTSSINAKLYVASTDETTIYGASEISEGVKGFSISDKGVSGISTSGIGGYFTSTSGYGLIVDNGNVGLGTTTPTSKLDVNGDVNISGMITQEAWQTPSLLNSWVNYGGSFVPAGYFIDSMGIVHLRGLVKDGSIGAGIPIFNLPVGYRPTYTELFNANSTGSLGFGRVDVNSNGDVIAVSGDNRWISLSGITFRVQ